MSAADVIAMTQEAPVAMTEEIPMTEPLVQVVDEDEDEDVVVVRRKRARPVEKGASDPANDDDVSPARVRSTRASKKARRSRPTTKARTRTASSSRGRRSSS